MERERLLVKNTFIIGLGTFLPKVASLITLPIVTEYLTKSEYGTYDLLLVLISLVLPLATLQIQAAAFRFLIENRSNVEKCKIFISNIVIFTIVMSTIPIIVIFAILGGYSKFTRSIICLYFFIDIILHTFQQIARGLGKNKVYAISTIMNSVLNMIFVLVFIRIYKMGLVGVISSLVISNGVTCIYIYYSCRIYRYIKFKLFKGKVIKELVSYSWPLIPNNLSSWVMTLCDRLILTFFMGVEVNAVYAVSKKIPNLLTIVQSTFSLAWQENAALSANDRDIDQYYSMMFDRIFCIVVGACSFLMGISPILFSILIQGDYSSAFSQMPILFLGMVFVTLSSYLGGIYIADKRTKEIGFTTTIAAIINLILDLVGIPLIGMYAASISTLMGYLFLFIYRIYDLKKYHHIKIRYKKLILLLTMLTVMCVLSALNNDIINTIILLVSIFIATILNKNLLKQIIARLVC